MQFSSLEAQRCHRRHGKLCQGPSKTLLRPCYVLWLSNAIEVDAGLMYHWDCLITLAPAAVSTALQILAADAVDDAR